MVSITDDSGTHTKCLLGLFNKKADQLESAAREVDWERELTIQLMVRVNFGLMRSHIPPMTGSAGHLEATVGWSKSGAGTRKVEKSNDLVT